MNILIRTGLTLPSISDEQVAQIQAAAGADAQLTVTTTAEEALAAAADIEAMIGQITPEIFAAAPKLRWVHAIASGVDHYLFPEFKASDAVLTGEKGLVGSHLADHAFALLLSLTRGLAKATRLGDDVWDHRMEFRRDNIELEGLTMGIVGFGGTGRAIAKRAAAFGMDCIAVDRDEVTTTPEISEVRPMTAFHELLEASDVVAVCCPLTDETLDLFDDEAFSHMKPTSIIVNVTRGPIINGDALATAIRSEQISGAGLDVQPEEPLPRDHAFWGLDRIVMTPHIAGASQLRAQRNIDRFCDNLGRLQRGEALDGLIDKELGF
ncbi:MAG TPA: D-2-hydroxyacid dehydrogenase [Dehalococcoidia bacterium]|nr:D-2-hydroxyacid dehydrogenase [Dehalococcoidia bacterium]